MAGNNNFQVFNPNSINQENDADYLTDALRVGGAPTNALFSSLLANKLFYQVTMMVAALAQCISVANQEALDTNLNDLANAIQATFGQKNVDWDATDGVEEILNKPTFLASLATNGYQILPSGLIIQWGTGTTSVGGVVLVNFSIPFPTVCLQAVASESSPGGWGATSMTSYGCLIAGPTSMEVRGARATNGGGVASQSGLGFRWIAVGY